MISGCALLVDYVLTITVSVAAGADALFSLSFFPESWLPYKMRFMVAVILTLMLLNVRGVKESVLPLVPIFLVFVATHAFIIVYAIAFHGSGLGNVFNDTINEVHKVSARP